MTEPQRLTVVLEDDNQQEEEEVLQLRSFLTQHRFYWEEIVLSQQSEEQKSYYFKQKVEETGETAGPSFPHLFLQGQSIGTRRALEKFPNLAELAAGTQLFRHAQNEGEFGKVYRGPLGRGAKPIMSENLQSSKKNVSIRIEKEYNLEDVEVGNWRLSVDQVLGILLEEYCPDQVQTRRYHLQWYKRCFVGQEFVTWLMGRFGIQQRNISLAVGQELERRGWLRHVVNEHPFKDDYFFYRWRWDENPFVLNRLLPLEPYKCDSAKSTEELAASPLDIVAECRSYFLRLKAHHTTENGIDYNAMSASRDFTHFRLAIGRLQRHSLGHHEELSSSSNHSRKAFFLNLYNLLVQHAYAQVGIPKNLLSRISFFNRISYDIAGVEMSLNQMENGLLRGNKRPPYSLTKPLENLRPLDGRSGSETFVDILVDNVQDASPYLKKKWSDWSGTAAIVDSEAGQGGDSLEASGSELTETNVLPGNGRLVSAQRDHLLRGWIFWEVDYRIHFALNCGATSCPPIKNYAAENIEAQLNLAAKGFCQDDQNVFVDTNSVRLSKIFQWYLSDFGGDIPALCNKIQLWLEGEKLSKFQKILPQIMSGTGKVTFADYDWKHFENVKSFKTFDLL